MMLTKTSRFGSRRIQALALTALSTLLIAVGACTSTSQPTTPIHPVFVSVHLNASAYRPLLSPGGIVRITQPATSNERIGYGGIVIARSLTETTFYAFDASCPVERESTTRVEIIDLGVRCPSCGSTFDVLYGSGAPTSGTAKASLRRYSATYNALLQMLTITS